MGYRRLMVTKGLGFTLVLVVVVVAFRQFSAESTPTTNGPLLDFGVVAASSGEILVPVRAQHDTSTDPWTGFQVNVLFNPDVLSVPLVTPEGGVFDPQSSLGSCYGPWSAGSGSILFACAGPPRTTGGLLFVLRFAPLTPGCSLISFAPASSPDWALWNSSYTSDAIDLTPQENGLEVLTIDSATGAPCAPPLTPIPTETSTPSPEPTATPPEAPAATATPGDLDEDGISDVVDNCPNDANESQLNSDSEPLQSSDLFGDACDADDDNDGLTDADEIDIYGTNPANVDTDGDGCSDPEELGDNPKLGGGRNPTDALDFPDLDGDQLISILDLTIEAQRFTLSAEPPAMDLDGDGLVSILDLTIMAQSFTHSCTAAP